MFLPRLHSILYRAACLSALILIGFSRSIPASAQTLVEARHVSHQFGWAIVDSHVNITADEGATWQDITPDHDSNELLSGVFFADKNTGYLTFLAQSGDTAASGTENNDNIVIARTIDGGQHWERSKIPNAQIPTAFLCCARATPVFVDALHGWLMAALVTEKDSSVGDLFSTADGGKTWHALPSPPSSNLPAFVTQDIGWIVGLQLHSLWRTQDGGRSWQIISVPPRNECTARCSINYSQPLFQDSLNGRIAVTFYQKGARSYVTAYTTRDGGNTWFQNDKYVEGGNEVGFDELKTVMTPDGLVRIEFLTTGLLDMAVRGQHKTAKFPWDPETIRIRPSGFINNNEGWIVVSAAPGEENNGNPGSPLLLVTANGGGSYTPISAQAICAACTPSPTDPAPHKRHR